MPSMHGVEFSWLADEPEFCAKVVVLKAHIIASTKILVFIFSSSRLGVVQNGGIGVVGPIGLLHASNDFVVFLSR
jgi:hypothetical protein